MAVGAELVRAAARRSPAVRGALAYPATQWTIQTLRGASAVSPAGGFVAGQLRARQSGSYRLRTSGLAVTLRHRSRDIDILNEIFGGTGGINAYAPPEALSAVLGAADPPRVMDLGANIGLFGLYVLGRWPSAQITAFEPDPDNAALLEQTIAANGLEQQWQVRREACSNRRGVVAFASGRLSESRIAEPGEPSTIEVPTGDLFENDHDVDLMKIDVEGGEWAILTDPRLASLKARAVVLEWHAAGCPEPDPHAAAIRLLGDAGYEPILDLSETHGAAWNVLWARRP
jgi:FkbM family methyltransferase